MKTVAHTPSFRSVWIIHLLMFVCVLTCRLNRPSFPVSVLYDLLSPVNGCGMIIRNPTLSFEKLQGSIFRR